MEKGQLTSEENGCSKEIPEESEIVCICIIITIHLYYYYIT